MINVVVLLNLGPEVEALGMNSSAAFFLVGKIHDHLRWPFLFSFSLLATLKTDFYKGI